MRDKIINILECDPAEVR